MDEKDTDAASLILHDSSNILISWKLALSLIIGIATGAVSMVSYANSFREQIRAEERLRLTDTLKAYVSKIEFAQFRMEDQSQRERETRSILLAIQRLSIKLDDEKR